jgi:hypothetical protein
LAMIDLIRKGQEEKLLRIKLTHLGRGCHLVGDLDDVLQEIMYLELQSSTIY